MDRQELIKYALTRFGAAPEYLWKKYPRYFVLRRPDNSKWFALVMDVPCGRLGLPGNGVIDVVDVKCGPVLMGEYLGRDGFLPAYHMSKTKWAAERLAAKLGADTLALIPKTAYPDKGFKKFLWGGKSAIMKEVPELEPYEVDITLYKRVILATPVWAGTLAPPLRTFIQRERENLAGERLAMVASSMSGSPGKTFENLKSLLGVTGDIPTLSLQDPKSHPSEENENALTAFCDRLT